MRYAVIGSDGIIAKVGECSAQDFALQAGEGQTVREISEEISDSTHRLVGDAFVEFEPEAENAATSIRRHRAHLLKSSDWTQMPDSPLSDEKKGEWATYRQALRELPQTFADAASLEDVTFPEPPEA